jgi:hypothetical protein
MPWTAVLFAGRDIEYPTRSRSYPVDASSVRSIELCVRAQDPRSDNYGGCARNFVLVEKQPTPLLVEHPIGFGWQIARFGDTAGQGEPHRHHAPGKRKKTGSRQSHIPGPYAQARIRYIHGQLKMSSGVKGR